MGGFDDVCEPYGNVLPFPFYLFIYYFWLQYLHAESDEQGSRDSLVPSMSSSTTVTSIGTADTETTKANMVATPVMGIEVGVTGK